MNVRRNVPSVEGARTPVPNRPIPPWRNNAMSSMLSAPANHPGDERRDLHLPVAATRLGDPEALAHKVAQTGAFSDLQDRCKASARPR